MKKIVKKQDLYDNFNYPLEEAAERLGLCSTTLKRRCRSNGIKKWPYRKIKSLNQQIENTKRLLCEKTQQREKHQNSLALLEAQKDYILKGSFSEKNLSYEEYIKEKESQIKTTLADKVIWHDFNIIEGKIHEKIPKFNLYTSTNITNIPNNNTPSNSSNISNISNSSLFNNQNQQQSLPPISNIINPYVLSPPSVPIWFNEEKDYFISKTKDEYNTNTEHANLLLYLNKKHI